MNTRLSVAVRECFSREISTHLPSFRVGKNREISNPDVFEFRPGPRICFFVLLTFAKDRDAFNVEIAFNEKDDFPWAEMPGTVEDVPSALSRGVSRFRVSKLSGEISDRWWTFGKEQSISQLEQSIRDKKYLTLEELQPKLEEVSIKVRDAVGQLITHAVPFFESIAKAKGVPLNIEVFPQNGD